MSPKFKWVYQVAPRNTGPATTFLLATQQPTWVFAGTADSTRMAEAPGPIWRPPC